MLSVMVLGHSGGRFECCVVSLSDDERSSLSDSDEEETDGKDGDGQPPVVKSEDDGTDSV